MKFTDIHCGECVHAHLEPDVIRGGQCDCCVLNDYGELWCMRDPNHTGRGWPTDEDGFCCRRLV